MKIFEVTTRQPKIGKGVQKATHDYLQNGELFDIGDVDFENGAGHELLRRLKKLGWTRLGNGYFSLVFSNPKKNYVLKVNLVNDPGYIEYVKLIKSHPNKYFPHISDMKILEVNGEEFGIYLIERLKEMDTPWNFIYSEILRGMMGVQAGGASVTKKGMLTLQNTPAPKKYNQDDWTEILDRIEENEEFVNAINLVVTWANKRLIGIDMHNGNIMQRSDGTAVITDPYAGLNSYEKEKAENYYQANKSSENYSGSDQGSKPVAGSSWE